MFEIFRISGPWGVLIGLLIVMNLVLLGWTSVHIMKGEEVSVSKLPNRINAILFWGIFGAVAGLLGQANGIYLSLRAIGRATEISPAVIMEGAAVSFLTTIMGLLLLLGSALAWMALRSLYRRRFGELAGA